ncbi:aspartic proteinase CDR1-like [Malania oleifera]|uniref:aspartic proteinase CDR1-like n=1 Tax=Malania oleifera TaxID=397392 RepID=UPI0025AE6F5B|nr:aspartic proteinase CDR1-like [Malania oleifera]
MAITSITQSILLLALALSIIFPTEARDVAGTRGFIAPLIHRDSPESPFYDSSHSHFYRLGKTILRSVSRAQHLNPSVVAPAAAKGRLTTTQMTNNGGDYLMRVSVGTDDPAEIFAVADTSSDLIWIQCSPCTDCYPQNAPMFNPHNSSSYQPINCDSRDCEFTVGGTCGSDGDFACRYSVFCSVGLENSFSRGVLAKESIFLGSTKIPNITVGCGFKNHLMYDDDNAQGMMGLGRGPVSLVSQLHDQIDGKFAYCLALNDSGTGENSSKIIFGDQATVSGLGAVSTALIAGEINSSYYVNLEMISVGNQMFDCHNLALLDTASRLTFLPQNLLDKLEAAVTAGTPKLKRVDDPYGFFSLCFNVSGESDLAGAPEFTMHFAGANVKLSYKNMFVKVTDATACLALGSTDGPSIVYGNLAQANFMVGFNLKNETVAFKPTDCAQM